MYLPLASNESMHISMWRGRGMRCNECCLAAVSVASVIVFAVQRLSVVAELDDVWRQVVESGRPRRAQRLRGADDHVAVVQSLLVTVDGQQAGTGARVGEHRVLPARDSEIDVPLLPQRALATSATLADEPVRRQNAVDERHERRVGVYLVEPVLELSPADWVRREPPRTDDLVQSIASTQQQSAYQLYCASHLTFITISTCLLICKGLDTSL